MIIERLRLLERCLIIKEKDKEREKTKRCRGQSEKGLQFDGLLSACGYRGTTKTINRREGKSASKNQQNGPG